MFVDEIENATLTEEPWHTAENYAPHSNGIDELVLHVPVTGLS